MATAQQDSSVLLHEVALSGVRGVSWGYRGRPQVGGGRIAGLRNSQGLQDVCGGGWSVTAGTSMGGVGRGDMEFAW